MPDWLAFLVTIAAAAAAAFGYLVYRRVGQGDSGVEAASRALQDEAERVRRIAEDQARGLRQEIGENLRNAHETALGIFRETGRGLDEQSRRNAEQIRDGLRAIETRLESGSGKHGADAALLREEIANQGHRLTEALFKSMIELRAAQAAEAEVLSRRLVEARETIRSNAEALQESVQRTLGETAARQMPKPAPAPGALDSGDIASLRETLSAGIERIEKQLTESLSRLGIQQVGRLEQVAQSLDALSQSQDKDQQALRDAIDAALDAIRRENANRVDELKRLKELEAENARLRVAVAELTLEKITLGERTKPGG